MKTKHISILLVLISTSFFSCDKIDELTEFDITDSFNTTINVAVNETSNEPQSFSQTATLNIATNQEIQDNLSLIQDINISSIFFEITNYSSSDDLEIILNEASLNFGTIAIDLEDINLKNADANNTMYQVNNSQLGSIANLLKNSTNLTTTLSGMISESPVSFNVIITVNLTVTIDAI